MWGFASPKRLRALGIVGMNKRNVYYIAQHNPRHLYPTVDDKLQTKDLCRSHDIAVPKLLGVCRIQQHTKDLIEFLKPYDQFVIKPAKGSGGKGILVVSGRDGNCFIKPSGVRISHQELQRHVSNILSGLFSLGGKTDNALIEDMVQFTDDFNGFSYEGVPDIRVILFKGYPVMAMTRLSTHASDGKANLHQGAVGVGLSIKTGKAIGAVQHNNPIKQHPDTGRVLTELKVPSWEKVMLLASRSYDVSGLGYLGVDIVLDRRYGPLLLELNARPGLAIQMANQTGLEPRLRWVIEQEKKANKVNDFKCDLRSKSVLTAEQKIRMAMDEFD
ncbi:MAG TPA: alpha-L-glutamate ligase-like protein [Oceanospirillales bacterium]|nr:alpha-L-glutamate ligase-like protein [Oceanospirillales bacterium]|tara:strand:+ start:436 stop:1425 length:990 start_codon:yes stop_codon:yes gene_type:complete